MSEMIKRSILSRTRRWLERSKESKGSQTLGVLTQTLSFSLYILMLLISVFDNCMDDLIFDCVDMIRIQRLVQAK